MKPVINLDELVLHEISALKAAFKDLYAASGSAEVAAPHIALGAVKTNIGHLEFAAGVAGVIKLLLQLQHRTLAPSLHCAEVNPFIDLRGTPFRLLDRAQEWPLLHDAQGQPLPRRGGVSSFGLGGSSKVNPPVASRAVRIASKRPGDSYEGMTAPPSTSPGGACSACFGLRITRIGSLRERVRCFAFSV